MTEIIIKLYNPYLRPLISQFPKISPLICRNTINHSTLPIALTLQLINNYTISTIGRRGAELDPLVQKWFKLLKLLGVKVLVAEC